MSLRCKDGMNYVWDGTRGLATSIPGTSITGPVQTSIPEAAVSGAVTSVVTGGSRD